MTQTQILSRSFFLLVLNVFIHSFDRLLGIYRHLFWKATPYSMFYKSSGWYHPYIFFVSWYRWVLRLLNNSGYTLPRHDRDVRHSVPVLCMLFTYFTTRGGPRINLVPHVCWFKTYGDASWHLISLVLCFYMQQLNLCGFFYFTFRKFNHICEQTRFKSWRSGAVCFST